MPRNVNSCEACFCVHFYPYGVTLGNGAYKSCRAGNVVSARKTIRNPEIYSEGKEVIVNYINCGMLI